MHYTFYLKQVSNIKIIYFSSNFFFLETKYEYSITYFIEYTIQKYHISQKIIIECACHINTIYQKKLSDDNN